MLRGGRTLLLGGISDDARTLPVRFNVQGIFSRGSHVVTPDKICTHICIYIYIYIYMYMCVPPLRLSISHLQHFLVRATSVH